MNDLDESRYWDKVSCVAALVNILLISAFMGGVLVLAYVASKVLGG